MTRAFLTFAPIGAVLLGQVILLAAGNAVARQSTQADQDILAADRLYRVVYLDLDSAEIRPEAAPKLDAQARWLLHNPWATARIEGNTDLGGSRRYNLALGDRRAHAVRDYLINHGVAASRMEAISFGEDRPVAEGSTVDGLARNRNTLTVIIANDAR